MILCVDVDYRDGPQGETTALAAGVVLETWTAAQPAAEYTWHLPEVEDYISGQFYRRELPCILALLNLVREPIDLIVVDGYVFLDRAGSPGLGHYLYEALGARIPIVGVAKNAFRPDDGSIPVLRGESKRPLYLSAVGVDAQRAAEALRNMHGRFRLPTALKRVDRLCRDTL